MPTVNIVYLPYRRFHYSELTLNILSKCIFKDFHITICGMNHQRGECEQVRDKARELGLSAEVLIVTSALRNYIDKLTEATTLPYKYSIKLDEDVFLGPQAWDYIFNNLHVLDNDQNILITPVLSSGIPTCDYFIEENLPADIKQNMINYFSGTPIPDLWGAQYGQLNEWLKRNRYTADGWYEQVAKHPHFYKGVHGIRLNWTAQLHLNQWIEYNIHKVLEPRDYELRPMRRPYLCNSVFAIRNDVWNKVLTDKSLFMDNFDEVAINNYRNRTGKEFLIAHNVMGIHTMFNTHAADVSPNNADEINQSEENFYQSIKTNILNQLK